jgi:hypothetical protein
MTTWTRRVAYALVLVAAGGCEVSTGDDFPDSGLGARGGAGGNGGSGARGGSGGSAGSSASGGTGELIDSGTGGTGGDDFESPTCEPEELDETDECLSCVKAQCCDQWLACDDQSCFDEWDSVNVCMQDIDEPGEMDFFECASESAADQDEMIVQENTNELLNCMREEVENDAGVPTTRCGLPCFGVEVLF